ncbi:MAG: PocR ligand-binding domain-containing protein [Clostridia bacterium]|nr:PocR ligand-binding domain-containing protein [Clostridia bacterium]
MNVEKVVEMLNNFRRVTGIDVSLLNADFHTVASSRGDVSRICAYIHSSHLSRDICRASDIERLLEVKDKGGAIHYTCPAGITEAIVPIIRGEQTVAYLIATIGIRECDLSAVEEMIKTAAPGLNPEATRERINDTRVLSDGDIIAHFEMLKLLGEHFAANGFPFDEPESIGTMIKYYVKNNLSEKITLSDIAGSLHCSTVTLTEHFKDEFGITIMEYVLRKRMELSERLMLDTDLPQREIAAKTGFADVEYFSRTFKRYHGISPAAWRKSKLRSK